MDVGNFSIECKHHKLAPLRAALAQAINDAADGLIPVAICKDDRKDPIVLLRYSDFMDMIREMKRLDDEANAAAEDAAGESI